ncbi:MAG TPA: SDR family oxidoreductase [Candidatus Dormibacteraeota bacterium]
MDLAGRVMMVTGASSGIGEATARMAHAQGMHVALAARREDRLRDIAGQLSGALAVPTDVTSRESAVALCDRTVERFGTIDVLVNNAGQGLHVPLLEVDPEDFQVVFALNVLAPLMLMQAVLPVMARQTSGAIVNVSSGTSRRVIPGLGAYAATKAALNMLSEVARKEFASKGVTVSLILPGITATEFHHSLRAGKMVGGGGGAAAAPELVAAAILEAARTGAPEVEVVSGR